MAHRNYFTYYFQFYRRGNQMNSQRKRYTGRGPKGPKYRSFFYPIELEGIIGIWMSSPTQEAPQTLAFRDFVQVSLCSQRFIESLTIGYWAQSPAPLPSLEIRTRAGRGGVVSGISNDLITWLVPLATSPHPTGLQGATKSHLISTNLGMNERAYYLTFLLPLSLRKFQGF